MSHLLKPPLQITRVHPLTLESRIKCDFLLLPSGIKTTDMRLHTLDQSQPGQVTTDPESVEGFLHTLSPRSPFPQEYRIMSTKSAVLQYLMT